jgi:hypothetical protein
MRVGTGGRRRRGGRRVYGREVMGEARVLAEEGARLAQQATGPSTRASVEGKGDVRFALVAPYRPASAQGQPASAQARSAHTSQADADAGQAREASSEAGRGDGRGGWRGGADAARDGGVEGVQPGEPAGYFLAVADGTREGLGTAGSGRCVGGSQPGGSVSLNLR